MATESTEEAGPTRKKQRVRGRPTTSASYRHLQLLTTLTEESRRVPPASPQREATVRVPVSLVAGLAVAAVSAGAGLPSFRSPEHSQVFEFAQRLARRLGRTRPRQPSIPTGARALSALERQPAALLRAICAYIDSSDVLHGLMAASRAACAFVCAPGSGALAHLRVSSKCPGPLRFLASDAWRGVQSLRVRLKRLARPNCTWWHAPFAQLGGGALHTLHLDEAAMLRCGKSSVGSDSDTASGGDSDGGGDSDSDGDRDSDDGDDDDRKENTEIYTSVPSRVWPALRELALYACSALRQEDDASAIDADNAVALNGQYEHDGVARPCVGVWGALPTTLPVIERLALHGYARCLHRAARYLEAADASRSLHTLVLDLGDWSASLSALVTKLAPRLAVLKIDAPPRHTCAFPALPHIQHLSLGCSATLLAASYPALETLAVTSAVSLVGPVEEWDAPRLTVVRGASSFGGWGAVLGPQTRVRRLVLHFADHIHRALGEALSSPLPSLERVGFSVAECVAAPSSVRAAVARRSPRAAVAALLRQPNLRHVCGADVDARFVDWAAAAPTLETCEWFDAGERPAALSPAVCWTSLRQRPDADAALHPYWCPT